jgi:osmoprotectant transport system substrate-binding protein
VMWMHPAKPPRLPFDGLRGTLRQAQGRLWGPLALIVLTLLFCGTLISCGPPHPNHPVIGAKNFTEQVVLGELLAQQIEAKGMKVDRRFYLAGSYICNQALISGRIDAYVEYTGTALTAILKQPVNRDPEAVLRTVRNLYQQRYHIAVLDPLGFENTFAMIIRGDDAARLHIDTLSESAQYTPQWVLGVGYEFEQRPDGLPGLSKAYDLHFKDQPRTMDLGLLYRAINAHQVDMIAGNSTDGPIASFHLKVLADDKHYFPPYQAVPLVRDAALQRWPAMRVAINELQGKVTADDMRAMNEAVDGEHRDPAVVVREFRQKKGL